MICECPGDYYLKEGVIDISISSAVYVADPIYVRAKGILDDGFNLICEADAIKKPIKHLHVDLCTLQIHWQPSTTYRFRFYEDFYRDPELQPNPQFDIEYTTNPLPEIASANPAFDDTDAVNNTTIRLNFDRHMCPGDAGNIYLYEVASPSDILLRTYDTATDVTLASDGTYVTFNTLGLLKASTQYYILTDADIYRDLDNFYLPQITSSTYYTFTTDASTDAFPDLISIEFVTGDVTLDYIRYRATASTLDVTTDISIDDRYRVRYGMPSLETTTFEIPNVVMTYNKGNLSATMTATFDGYDIFTTYTASGKAILNNDFSIFGRGGPLRDVGTIMSTNAALDILNYRPRFFDSNLSTSSFSQSSSMDYGILSSVRSNGSYQTNTDSLISDGPFILDSRGPSGATSHPFWMNSVGETYTVDVTPTSGAVSNITVPSYVSLDDVTGHTTTGGSSANSKPLGTNGIYYAASMINDLNNGITSIGIFKSIDNSLVIQVTGLTFVDSVKINSNNDFAVLWSTDGTVANRRITVYDIAGNNKFTKNASGSTDWGQQFDLNAFHLYISYPSYSTNRGVVQKYDIADGSFDGFLLTGSNVGDYCGRLLAVSDEWAVTTTAAGSAGPADTGYLFSLDSLGAHTFLRNIFTDNGSATHSWDPISDGFKIYGDDLLAIKYATASLEVELIDLTLSTNYLKQVFVHSTPSGWTTQYVNSIGINQDYVMISTYNSSNATQTQLYIFDKSTASVQQTISDSSIYYSVFMIDNLVISTMANGNDPGRLYPTLTTSSYASGILTLTGGAVSVNVLLNNMTITPTTGYSSDFTLTYTATRDSDSFESTRDQDIDNV